MARFHVHVQVHASLLSPFQVSSKPLGDNKLIPGILVKSGLFDGGEDDEHTGICFLEIFAIFLTQVTILLVEESCVRV